MTLEELKETLVEVGHEESIVFENPDYASAAIGVTEEGRVVYSYPLMVSCLMKEDNITEEEAADFICTNTIRALPYAHGNAPVILYPFDD